MKSPLRFSNRLSSFRFSLASIGPLRSPVSPLTPQSPPHTIHNPEPLPKYHQTSSVRSSTAPTFTSTEPVNEKASGLAVTVVESSTDSHAINESIRTPTALPTPTHTTYASTTTNQHFYHQPSHSPITPWHATFHRNAASTTQETTYLTQTTHLRRTRIAISLLLFLFSTIITALTSDTLHHYLTANLPTSFPLPPLWPTDTNLTPTILTLTTSVLTLLLTLPTTTLHLLRGPNPRTKLCNILFTLLTTITTILSLATLTTSSLHSPSPLFSNFISKTLTALVITTGPRSTTGLSPNGVGSAPRAETIQSFTCSLSNTAAHFTRDAKTLSLPYPTGPGSSMVPSGFPRLCLESRVSVALVVVLCIVAALGVGVAAWSWVVEKRIEAFRGEREVLASRDGGCESVGGKVMEMPAFVKEGDLERRC